VRVAGTADPEWFLESGRLTAATVTEELERHGVEGAGALLDFGCGCGRVIRHWEGRDDLHGCDRDAEAVRWCREHLPFAQFEQHGADPPLPYPDGRFGAVSAISVFTHLPEGAQAPWRDELRRILAPRGLLVVTTHGELYANRFSPEQRERFEAGQLVVRRPAAAGTNLCTAFHPERYVRDVLAEGFELLEFRPGGASGTPTQDLSVLRVVWI
jgi:SAM-dependent methyltransferase